MVQRWLLEISNLHSIEKCTLSRNQLSTMINIKWVYERICVCKCVVMWYVVCVCIMLYFLRARLCVCVCVPLRLLHLKAILRPRWLVNTLYGKIFVLYLPPELKSNKMEIWELWAQPIWYSIPFITTKN